MADTTSITITAGAVVRRPIRRYLMEHPEISFREDRGLLDSLFVVSGAPEDVLAVGRVIQRAFA